MRLSVAFERRAMTQKQPLTLFAVKNTGQKTRQRVFLGACGGAALTSLDLFRQCQDAGENHGQAYSSANGDADVWFQRGAYEPVGLAATREAVPKRASRDEKYSYAQHQCLNTTHGRFTLMSFTAFQPFAAVLSR